MATETPKIDVVIVGAGLSGLRAAKEIHNAGLSYAVLEALDRVGGKTLSMPTKDNGKAPVDLGAAWINDSGQAEMYALAQEFGLGLEEQRVEGTSIDQDTLGNITSMPYGMESGVRLAFFSHSTNTADNTVKLSSEQASELESVMAAIMEYVGRSNLENPHLGPDAAKLDSLTAMEFAEEGLGGSDAAHMLIAAMTRGLLGVNPDEISALQLVDYVKSATGLTNVLSEQKDGAQYLRVSKGSLSFATSLAAQLNPGSIRLSSPVKLISQSGGGCLVETTDGTKYSAAKVILSVPTPLYHKIRFEPELPAAKKALGQSTKFGYYAKTVLVFSSPWWREAGLSGCLNSEKGPISFARDTCASEEEQYSITCFHVAEAGRIWSELPAEKRREAVLEQYRTMFGAVAKEVPEPVQVLEKEWTKDPWVGGAAIPVMLPGVMTADTGRAIRDPVGHIHFVGTETAVMWKGFMEGAVRAGVRGAKEVITARTST